MFVQVSPTAADPLQELEAAATDLAGEDLHRLPAAGLREDLRRLVRLIDRLEAELVRRLGVFDKTQGFVADGDLSSAAWLRHHCRLAPGEAAERVRVARQLPERPATARAFAAGELSFRHTALLTRTLDEVGPGNATEAEPILLQAARDLDPLRLGWAARHLRHCVDPEGALAEAEDLHERRRVHLSESWRGLHFLDGQLDPEGGCLLRTALDSLMGVPGPDDRRSAGQRRADALVELARRELDRGELPEAGGERPHLTLTCDLTTLEGVPGAPAGELEGGQPVPAATAQRIACDASIVPLLVDGAGQPLRLGRRRRLVSSGQRRALALRDRGCRWPGCDRPVSWCDAHHLREWGRDGQTNLDELALVCRRHHRRLHEGRWRLERTEGGGLTARPP